MRFVRHSASALAFLCLYTMPLTAQNIGTVRGQVVDSSTRQALAGVTVQIQGTARSTLTGPAGNYSLGDVPAGRPPLRATPPARAPPPAGVTARTPGIHQAAVGKAPPAATRAGPARSPDRGQRRACPH